MKRTLLVGALAAIAALGCSREKPDPYAEEVRAREAFAKKILLEADAGRALGMSSTTEIQFEEGFGVLSYEQDPGDGHESISNHAFRWMGQNAHVRLKTRGPRAMRLQMDGWVHHKVVETRPVMTLYVDGAYLGTVGPVGGSGHYFIDMRVPEWMLRRPWVDLVVKTNAVAYHWADVPELRVLNAYRFAWTEAD